MILVRKQRSLRCMISGITKGLSTMDFIPKVVPGSDHTFDHRLYTAFLKGWLNWDQTVYRSISFGVKATNTACWTVDNFILLLVVVALFPGSKPVQSALFRVSFQHHIDVKTWCYPLYATLAK